MCVVFGGGSGRVAVGGEDRVDPMLDVGVEDLEGKRALAEDDIVKVALVVKVSKGAHGAAFEIEDLHLAALVGEGLSGPRDVSIDLGGDLEEGKGRVVDEKIDRLLSRPSEGVDASINDKTTCTKHLIIETSKIDVWIGVEAHTLAQTLGIEGPTLDEGGPIAVDAKSRKVLKFCLDRDLQMVSGHTLVQRQRIDTVDGTRWQIVRVDVIDAGMGALRIGLDVKATGLRGSLSRGGLVNLEGATRQLAKVCRQHGLNVLAE